jgi:uncharacterized protein (AIM24 family)
MFEGNPDDRVDEFFSLKDIFRKHSFLRAVLSGPSRCILSLNSNFFITIIDIREDNNLLYEFKNILFYSHGISLSHVFQPVKHMLTTKSIVKAKFEGEGKVGLMSSSPLIPIIVTSSPH